MNTHVEETHIHGPGIPTFVRVWAALLAMTAIEVFLAYMQTPMLIFCIVLMLIFLGDAYRIPAMRPPV